MFLSVWPGGRRLRPASWYYVVAALNDTLRPGVRLLIPAYTRSHKGHRGVDLRRSTPLLSASPGLLGAQRPQGQLVQRFERVAQRRDLDVTMHQQGLVGSAQRPTSGHADVRTRPGFAQAQNAWDRSDTACIAHGRPAVTEAVVCLDRWVISLTPPSAHLVICGVRGVPCTRLCRRH